LAHVSLYNAYNENCTMLNILQQCHC